MSVGKDAKTGGPAPFEREFLWVASGCGRPCTVCCTVRHIACSRTSRSRTCSRMWGRRSIPPQIVAVVMSLQRMEGLSDREAVERFAFDLRWKYAAGGLDYDHPGFVHTVLVDMRARLARSERPNRIFEGGVGGMQSGGAGWVASGYSIRRHCTTQWRPRIR